MRRRTTLIAASTASVLLIGASSALALGIGIPEGRDDHVGRLDPVIADQPVTGADQVSDPVAGADLDGEDHRDDRDHEHRDGWNREGERRGGGEHDDD